jgi:hypothetical protein
MRIGYIRQVGIREFKTVNGRILIRLVPNKGHVHVRVSGSIRFTALTHIKSDLSKLEYLYLASYIFSLLCDDPRQIPASAEALRSCNYSMFFGSMWIGGVE